MNPCVGIRMTAMWAFAMLLCGENALPALAQDGAAPVRQDSAENEFAIPLDLVPEEVRDQFLIAVADLTLPDWSQREGAEQWLMQSPVPDEVFHAMLNSGTLAPEQEHRMIAILRDRILGHERGAMGIKMTTGVSPVQVVEVRPNMPAQGRLQVGDTIIALDGFAIMTSTDLERVLLDRRPGEEIEVTVRRRKAAADPAAAVFEETTLTVSLTLTDDSLFSEEEQEAWRQAQLLRARDFVAQNSPRPTPLRVPFSESMIDEPAEVAALRRQLAEYIASDAGTRRDLREQWRATRDALLVATLASGISDAERQRRWEVYTAYVELLPPGVD